MLTLQNKQEEKINVKALLITIGTHLLLLCLFMLLHHNISNPVAVADMGGLEVNLGTDDNGSGTDQPMKNKKPSKEFSSAVVYKTTASKSNLPKNVFQSQDNNATPLTADSSLKTENDRNKEKTEKQVQPKYTYSGETGEGGNGATENKPGKSEGNTHGSGDRGVPNGTPGAANYTGIPGNGSGGIGHTLTGRKITPDRFDAEFNESGKVIIHVTVDRNGTIVNKRVVSSSNQQLTTIALEKLKDAKFTKSESVEPQQFGDITIIFKTH